jgi:DNA modification methylase
VRAKEQKQDRYEQGKTLVEVFAQEPPPAELVSDTVRRKEIELLEAGTLKPFPTNPRRHSRDNVAKIARSIQTYGWTTPVLITDACEVIAGHGRLLAAKQIGQSQIPCIRLSHLTPELVEAYRIADNRLALDSEWDDQLLTEAIRRLSQDPGFDLKLTGFDQGEIDDFLFIPGTGLTGEDDVPLPDETVVAARGDIWQLGTHRLICADACNAAEVTRLLAGVTPSVMVTDPPYGVDYDATARRQIRHQLGNVKHDAPINNDNRADWSEALGLFQGNIAYVWHGALHCVDVWQAITQIGFEIRCQLIWVKQHAPLGRGAYSWQHEPCFYAIRKGSRADWKGPAYEPTVLQVRNLNAFGGSVDPADGETTHSVQKPVECMRRPIVNHTSTGQAVYDPFMGSGTTIIAAETTGRVAYGVEINPLYVDMAIRRWQAYTGNVARLAGDGKTFEEVAEWRKAK